VVAWPNELRSSSCTARGLRRRCGATKSKPCR
jgi:hypothetical protein